MPTRTPRSSKLLVLEVELTPDQAWILAQFHKRVGFYDFRRNAQDDNEAYAMQDAAERVRKALVVAGFNPR